MNDSSLAPYSQQMFVDRETIRKQLTDRLFNPQTGSSHRSIIVEAPGARGKTWLLEQLNHQFTIQDQDNKRKWADVQTGESQSYRPRLVLFIKSREFKGIKHEGDINNLALGFLRQLQKQMDLSLHVRTVTTEELKNLISDFVALLLRNPSNPIVILILDGMEEIVEQAPTDAEIDVLYTFEKNFLAPLLKYPYARLLASRRIRSTAYWKTLTIKPLTEIKELHQLDEYETTTGKDSTQEQFKKLQVALDAQDSYTFQELQQELEGYEWKNPGANASLIEAFLKDGSISSDDLHQTIDTLLRSPTGKDLDKADRNNLFTLIQVVDSADPLVPHAADQPIPLRKLNDVLGFDLTNIKRNEFVRKLQEHGIGVVKRHAIQFTPELVQLIRAALNREATGAH